MFQWGVMQTLAATCDIQRHAKFARSTYFECWVLNKIVQQQDQVDVHMIQKCHADLGGVQVAATLSTGPLCVQWRQQQLISGALFHVGIRKRDISSEERALTGQTYLGKINKQICHVMCCASDGVNSWYPALFSYVCIKRGCFEWKSSLSSPFDLLKIHHTIARWSADVRYQSDLRDTSEKAVSVNAKWEVQQRQQKADLFKLKCSWSKRRRGHTYISKQLSWVVICPLKKN